MKNYNEREIERMKTDSTILPKVSNCLLPSHLYVYLTTDLKVHYIFRDRFSLFIVRSLVEPVLIRNYFLLSLFLFQLIYCTLSCLSILYMSIYFDDNVSSNKSVDFGLCGFCCCQLFSRRWTS